MLVEFKVSNFKNFKEELVFDLSQHNNYEFNQSAILNQGIKTAMVYGANGSGKSNLGLAIFDIIIHLTDKEKNLGDYLHYLNLNTPSKKNAEFYYRFRFDDSEIVYCYSKSNPNTLVKERLEIDGRTVAEYNHIENEGNTVLAGTESLKTDLNEKKMSFVKYISSNAVLADTKEGKVFKRFIDFVDTMLMFSSLERNRYRGFRAGDGKVSEIIIGKSRLADFQKFLYRVGLDYKLAAKEVDGEKKIICKFDNKEVDFFSIASRGTSSLALFFCWLIQLRDVSFVFIDEFDAFYHDNLAQAVIEALKNSTAQAIVTTHNTSIMTNDLLRPDCFFSLENGKINSFSSSTTKELRQAHNLSKMYKAGAFDAQ